MRYPDLNFLRKMLLIIICSVSFAHAEITQRILVEEMMPPFFPSVDLQEDETSSFIPDGRTPLFSMENHFYGLRDEDPFVQSLLVNKGVYVAPQALQQRSDLYQEYSKTLTRYEKINRFVMSLQKDPAYEAIECLQNARDILIGLCLGFWERRSEIYYAPSFRVTHRIPYPKQDPFVRGIVKGITKARLIEICYEKIVFTFKTQNGLKHNGFLTGDLKTVMELEFMKWLYRFLSLHSDSGWNFLCPNTSPYYKK